MCGFIKGKKLVFVNSEQQDTSFTFIFPSYQGPNTSENTPELEEWAEVPPVQEYNTQKLPIQKLVPEQKPTSQT